eukprot:scaffold138964_cov104-Cyclotella_meneghiniana.AAC.1
MWAYRSPPDTGPRAQHPEEPPSNIIFRALVDWSDGYDAALVLWVWGRLALGSAEVNGRELGVSPVDFVGICWRADTCQVSQSRY